MKGILLKNKCFLGKDTKEKGITLIALVITIIVLIILAGVTIAMLVGENGILTKAIEGKEQTRKAGAEEQVQIAVMGSIKNDGNIDNKELKNNLDKIDKITGVPEEITDEDFPLTVNVDGYDVVINKDGTIKEAGKWKEVIEDGETIITDGNIKLKVGDYINYDPRIDENGEKVVNEDGTPKSYTSPEGTNLKAQGGQIQEVDVEKGNGYSEQTYSVDSQTNGWRVLGLDKEKDEIQLISAYVLKDEEGENQTYFLSTQTGSQYGKSELNSICAIFGEGKGASSARCITAEDVNNITGYDPEKTGDGHVYNEGRNNEYGNEVKYTINPQNQKIEYSSKNESGQITLASRFGYYDEEQQKWKLLKANESKTIISRDYFYYPYTLTDIEEGETVGKITNKQYDVLFGDSYNNEYWLATDVISVETYGISYGFYSVANGFVYACQICRSGGESGTMSKRMWYSTNSIIKKRCKYNWNRGKRW